MKLEVSEFVGMSRAFAPSKKEPGMFQLITNGRTLRNAVTPIKRSSYFETPKTPVQGIACYGEELMVAAGGQIFTRNLVRPNADWVSLNVPLGVPDARVYFQAVPQAAFNGYYVPTVNDGDLDPSNCTLVLPSENSVQSAGILVTDGLRQPRLITTSGVRKTQNYEAWTTDQREYVPLGICPALTKTKLFLVSPDRKSILPSVSGRFLDFVIKVDGDAEKLGDAYALAAGVSYDNITAMIDTQDGQLLVGTDRETYLVSLDYTTTMFGEPLLVPVRVLPVGIVNQFAAADIIGDVAIITPTGIHSMNVTAQTQTESNNFPLGADIEDFLEGDQTNSCACSFGTYALFAVNTIFGDAVLVLNRMTKKFVSLDRELGAVRQFATATIGGQNRLFYYTANNRIAEAYVGEPATCRVYLGDYSLKQGDGQFTDSRAGTRAVVGKLNLTFHKVYGTSEAAVTFYADRREVARNSAELTAPDQGTFLPEPMPFASGKGIKDVSFSPAAAVKGRTFGAFVEWKGNAELIAAEFELKADEIGAPAVVTAPDDREVFIITGDQGMDQTFDYNGTTTHTLVTDQTPGDWFLTYDGQAHVGDKVYENTVFQLKGDALNYTGYLWNVTRSELVKNAWAYHKPDYILGVGDHLMPNGAEQDVERFKLQFAQWLSKMYLVPGNHDFGTDTGMAFRTLAVNTARPVKQWQELVRFTHFDAVLLTDFIQTDGTFVTGHNEDSMIIPAQARLAESTKDFKIVLSHHPFVSDPSTYSGLQGYYERIGFGALGASMLFSGHNHNYQHLVKDGIQHVVCGLGGSSMYPVQQVDAIQTFHDQPGFVKLTARKGALLVEAFKVDGTLADQFELNL